MKGMELLPLLVQVVEKAAAQSTQLQFVSEAVFAASIIIKLLGCDAQSGEISCCGCLCPVILVFVYIVRIRSRASFY